MSTYTIKLDGLYYACGMDTFAEYVYALEAPCHIAKVRKSKNVCEERNMAIRSVCRGYEKWKDAYQVAKRCGKYIGDLFVNGWEW